MGLSTSRPDNGLDTGDVLIHRKDAVVNDTLGSVYFDRLFPLGVEATPEAVPDLVKAGKAPRIKQDEDAKATYVSCCGPEHNAHIDCGAALAGNRPFLYCGGRSPPRPELGRSLTALWGKPRSDGTAGQIPEGPPRQNGRATPGGSRRDHRCFYAYGCFEDHARSARRRQESRRRRVGGAQHRCQSEVCA